MCAWLSIKVNDSRDNSAYYGLIRFSIYVFLITAECHEMMTTNRKYHESDECALGVEVFDLQVFNSSCRSSNWWHLASQHKTTQNLKWQLPIAKNATFSYMFITWKNRNICPNSPRYGTSSLNTFVAIISLTQQHFALGNFSCLLSRRRWWWCSFHTALSSSPSWYPHNESNYVCYLQISKAFIWKP